MCLVGSDAQTGEKGIRLTGPEAEQHSLTPALQGCQRQLATTNTIFCLANERKTLWTHSRSEQWHLTDNQHWLLVNLRLCANDHNWQHSEFLGTTQSRDRATNYLPNIKMETRPGGPLPATTPNTLSAKGFPITSELNLPGCYEAGHFLKTQSSSSLIQRVQQRHPEAPPKESLPRGPTPGQGKLLHARPASEQREPWGAHGGERRNGTSSPPTSRPHMCWHVSHKF